MSREVEKIEDKSFGMKGVFVYNEGETEEENEARWDAFEEQNEKYEDEFYN